MSPLLSQPFAIILNLISSLCLIPIFDSFSLVQCPRSVTCHFGHYNRFYIYIFLDPETGRQALSTLFFFLLLLLFLGSCCYQIFKVLKLCRF